MKKIVALLLCLVMIVGVMSTTALAKDPTPQQLAVAAAYDTFAGMQEYGIAVAVKKAIDSVAAGFYKEYVWVLDGVEQTEEQYAASLLAIFQEKFDKAFDGKTFAAKDLKAFVAATMEAYNKTGAEFMADLMQAMVDNLKLELQVAGYDPAMVEWIDSMS